MKRGPEGFIADVRSLLEKTRATKVPKEKEAGIREAAVLLDSADALAIPDHELLPVLELYNEVLASTGALAP